MPTPLDVPEGLRSGPFTLEQARGHGLERWHLRGSRFRTVHRGVYVCADVPHSRALRLAAAALVVPKDGAVGGRWAAWAWGADVLRGDADPVVLLAPGPGAAPRRQAVRSRSLGLLPDDVEVRRGCRVTTALRTACDLARGGDLVDGVVAVDALVRAQARLDVPAVATELERWAGRPSTPLAQEVARLARPGVDSPMETRTRLLLVLGGLPEPEVSVEVRVGRRLVVLDMAWRQLKVCVEFDGLVHDGVERRARDTERLTALTAAGWIVLRFRSADVLQHPERLVAQVWAALATAEAGQVA